MGGKVNVFDQYVPKMALIYLCRLHLYSRTYPRHDVISDEKLAADLSLSCLKSWDRRLAANEKLAINCLVRSNNKI